MLPQLLKFEEQSQTVLGRQALGFKASHDGEVGFYTNRGVVIKIFEKFKSSGGPDIVLEGWLCNTEVKLPISVGHVCGELDSRFSMYDEVILLSKMSRAPWAP